MTNMGIDYSYIHLLTTTEQHCLQLQNTFTTIQVHIYHCAFRPCILFTPFSEISLNPQAATAAAQRQPNLWGFLTPPVAGADFRAALVANCLRGAFPPVDFLAVCLVRAILSNDRDCKCCLCASNCDTQSAMWVTGTLTIGRFISRV